MRYVNVDAVPVSLTYCFQYLRARFPDRKVSIVTRGSLIDLDSDFLVVPAWNLSLLDQLKFDISMNIESFQEMSQSIVNSYISLIDRLSREGSYVYLVNARNYKFKGAFNFPARWDCLYRHQSPNAWSKNHPTEVFEVMPRGSPAQSRIRQVIFDRDLALVASANSDRQAKEVAEQAACAAAALADSAAERADFESKLRTAAERTLSTERTAREAAEELARQAPARASAERAFREAAEELAQQAAACAAASQLRARRLLMAVVAVAGAAIIAAGIVAR